MTWKDSFREWGIGETAHIWMPSHRGNTTAGKIIHKFEYGVTLYVIEIDCYPESLYECRSGSKLEMHLSPIVDEDAVPGSEGE